MLQTIKLKGGALYVSVIISILISIILSLFIVIAHYNTRSIQSQTSLFQLQLSLESGFEIAGSTYYSAIYNHIWQKIPDTNDSVMVKKMPWGCFTIIDVKAKSAHFNLQKTGLFGCSSTTDTALLITEQNHPLSLAGNIKFNGSCYLPKAGIKPAYVQGNGFSELSAIRPFIKPAPTYLTLIDGNYLKGLENSQSGINPYTDSICSFIPDLLNQPFQQKTVVIQQGSVMLNEQVLSNNIKIISSNVIAVENSCQLNHILLIARKVIFKKGFKGTVHVIAKDSIVTEDNCEFDYPSSFCIYSPRPIYDSKNIRGIFFGSHCKLKGGMLAANDKDNTSAILIRLNDNFELIGNLYSSNYAQVQGNIYGSVLCQSLLLQTPSAVYENYLMNCVIDPKTYGLNLVVPKWFKEKKYTCAKWF